MSLLRVTAPEEGRVLFRVEEHPLVAFAFDFSGVTFERHDDDLVLTMEDGREVVLEHFFLVEEGGELPVLQLADGTEISSADFLMNVSPGLDVTTAAGPETSSPDSGGGLYADDAGSLIDGIDRLGTTDFMEQRVDIRPAHSFTKDVFAGGVADGDPAYPPVFPGSVPGNPGTGGDETPGIEPPYTYVRAALLGVDGAEDPVVSVNLLDPDGNKLPGPFPRDVVVEGGNGRFIVSYDETTGMISFRLAHPELGPLPAENFTVIVDGKSYLIQVGTAAGKDLADVQWVPVEEGIDYAGKTWAGVTGEHLEGDGFLVDGHSTGANITTPDGYDDTELHLQMTDSSLTALEDEARPEAGSVTVDLELNGGSLTIDNQNHAGFTVSHGDPLDINPNGWGVEGYDTSGTEYTASATAALGAKGESAENTVTVANGDVILNAGSSEALQTGNSEGAYVSGVLSVDGGTVTVKADNIDVNTVSGGLQASGTTASVSGVHASGAVIGDVERSYTDWNGEVSTWTDTGVSKQSEVRLSAGEDLNIRTAVAGDTSSGHYENTSYAGVAATENGRVDIDAGGDVHIDVTNTMTGGDLSTAGIYGIFSGYGFGADDLYGLEDFPVIPGEEAWGDINNDGYDEYAYESYMRGISEKYYENKRGDYNAQTDEYEPREGEFTEVTVKAAGDVNVAVNLGSGDYDGKASGIKAAMGDVRIDAGGAINVNTLLDGEHKGDSANVLSAMELGNSRAYMRAEGDINLGLKANGDHLAVVNYHPYAKDGYDYGVDPTHLSAANVTLKGEAGYGGGMDNHIAGIDASNANFKKQAFTVSADEKFTIDVSAFNNGGTTSVTGIALGQNDAYYDYYQHSLTVATDAPEVVVNARVEGGAEQGESRATGLFAGAGSQLAIRSYESLDEFRQGGDYGLSYDDAMARPVDSLTLNVGGARYNTGVGATGGTAWEGRARVDIRASDLTVNVTGGAVSGASSSYGLLAQVISSEDSYPGSEQAKINIETSNMTITVDNPQHSVGIGASGAGSEVKIGSAREYDAEEGNLTSSPLSVTINCTITNGAEQLRGIAIEALDGGYVTIRSNQQPSWQTGQPLEGAADDTISINGDIVARSAHPDFASNITIDTGFGNDKVDINGDILLGANSQFLFHGGDGNDSLSVNGNLLVDAGGQLDMDAGDGDDTVSLNGRLSGDDIAIRGGEGNDTLVLTAPDAATFNAWYREWLEQDGRFDDMSFENIVVKGVDSMEDLAWLADLLNNHGEVNLEVYGSDGSPTVMADFSPLGAGFVNAPDDDDLLPGSPGASDLPDPINDDVSLNDFRSVSEAVGDFMGLEASDGSIDDLLNGEALDSPLASVRGPGNESTVLLKSGSAESMALERAGWYSAGEAAVINGEEYQVYTDPEADALYLQLLATNG